MRVLSGLLFFPRGGSAQVARALATELPRQGWDVSVLSGSLGSGRADARQFYSGLDVHSVDFDAGDAPMHPSYEDRPDAPDRCFAMVDDEAYREHVAAWARAMERAGAASADVLHLHHLTPLNEAAALAAPGVPIVGHLHGTELMMLERIAAGPPPEWTHADAWAKRMRRWAQGCERLILLADS
ncbi:MAG TPA: glycosyltransferase family 4 protein, partial [Thermoleophilaceae bacterium]|nr:glycosyltransferase family 4 protein [Thermoleophilaceae bacterium]